MIVVGVVAVAASAAVLLVVSSPAGSVVLQVTAPPVLAIAPIAVPAAHVFETRACSWPRLARTLPTAPAWIFL